MFLHICPSSFVQRKPFVSIAINKKVQLDGERCPFRLFCVSKVISTAHAHKSGVIFHNFPRAFKQKKIKALRPKMTKIASRGSCLNSTTRRQACHCISSTQAFSRAVTPNETIEALGILCGTTQTSLKEIFAGQAHVDRL